MTQCTCGRGFHLKTFTEEPRIDGLCPKCLLASTPTPENEDFTLEQLEEAYQRDMNNNTYLEKEYPYG